MIGVCGKLIGFSRKVIPPSRNSDCLCGSGKKFKRCCADTLPERQLGKGSRAALNVEDYATALAACRADITQYTLWHKAHTEPLLGSAPGVAEYLLNLDIRVLAELAELLQKCYAKTDKSDDFSATLERLRSNINHPRWHRKIIYLQAIHALSPDWNEHAGRRELRKLGSMESETDVEILQLYIDLFHDNLTFAVRQKLVDRVILLAESAIDRLHYRCLRAVDFMLIGDTRETEQELIAAVDAYKTAPGENADSLYGRHRYAMALELLGQLRNDPQLLDQAIAICKELIEQDSWTESGKASMLCQLGGALRCKSEWAEARDAYQQAFATQPLPILQVLLAECLLATDGWKVAAKAIRAVAQTKLEAAEFVDYVFTFALVAIDGEDGTMLAEAEQLLRNLDIPTPYFRERRDSLLLAVIDTVRSGRSSATTNRARTLLQSMASVFRVDLFIRYVKLEPNFMGIGINLGKLMEDLSKGEQEHSTKRNRH